MQRSDAQGFYQTLAHLSFWFVTGSLVYFCWLRAMYPAMIVALWMHGTVGSTFIYGCHELGHATVFKTRWLNKFFLSIFSVLWWWDPIDYAASHTYHHRYTQFPEGDRENLFPLEPSLDPWVLLQMFTVNLTSRPGRVFGKGGLISTVKLTWKAAMGGIASEEDAQSHEWLTAVHADPAFAGEAAKSMWFSRAIIAFHSVVFVASILSGQWIFILLVNFHCFIASWYSYFVGTCQHVGLKSASPDFRKNTRSITLDPFSEILFWRMNWHCEHHMFAGVPCYNLKALHYEVRSDMPVPRSLIGAWREMREIWRQQQIDPSYEFDTPLPETANTGGVAVFGGVPSNAPVTEEASIGDLAPNGLKQTQSLLEPLLSSRI